MDQELEINQGEGLKIVSDRAMHGGICFAITTQWAFLLLRGIAYDTELVTGITFRKQKSGDPYVPVVTKTTTVEVQKGFFTLVSLQRGYDLVDLLIADKMDAGQQDIFFKVASEFSQKYLASLCRSDKFTLKPMEVFKSVDQLVPTLSFASGTIDLIGIFGVEDGKNWGHIVGTAKTAKDLFFDANSGQWTSPGDKIKSEIASYLKSNYAGIQNCVRYTITK